MREYPQARPSSRRIGCCSGVSVCPMPPSSASCGPSGTLASLRIVGYVRLIETFYNRAQAIDSLQWRRVESGIVPPADDFTTATSSSV
jgi:hypothetical protein